MSHLKYILPFIPLLLLAGCSISEEDKKEVKELQKTPSFKEITPSMKYLMILFSLIFSLASYCQKGEVALEQVSLNFCNVMVPGFPWTMSIDEDEILLTAKVGADNEEHLIVEGSVYSVGLLSLKDLSEMDTLDIINSLKEDFPKRIPGDSEIKEILSNDSVYYINVIIGEGQEMMYQSKFYLKFIRSNKGVVWQKLTFEHGKAVDEVLVKKLFNSLIIKK